MQRQLVFLMPMFLVALIAGCQSRRPDVVTVEGKVTLDGQPVPHARVEFIPKLDDFGASMNSYGETDDDGYFTLTCSWENKSGACVGTHWVVVGEVPAAPGVNIRKEPRPEPKANRPLPPEYNTIASTPLVIEVVRGKTQYDLPLVRSEGSE